MSILINVTARDIRLGEPKSHRQCPIARAIYRHFPGRLVEVSGARAWLDADKLYGVYLPESAVQFISAYDQGDDVEPFRFRLVV